MRQQRGPIFIGGAGRSGTTLMRVILDSHPAICCGPELKLLPMIGQLHQVLTRGPLAAISQYYQNTPTDVSRHFRHLIESFVENFRRTSGKPRWAEKTPENVSHMLSLGEIFPDARFLHMLRDGRDVACSLVTMNWINPATGEKSWHTVNIANAARYWRRVVEAARRQTAHPSLAGRVLEVRYERLVTETEKTLRQVLNFLEEPWHDDVMHYFAKDESRRHEPPAYSDPQTRKPVYTESMGRWHRDMSDSDQAAFLREAGKLLQDLGYANGEWSHRPAESAHSAGPVTAGRS